MQSILEELYFGNIHPDSRVYGQDSPFAKASRVRRDNYDKLMSMLSATEKEVFEQYCDAQGEKEGIINYDTFTYALKFGMLLMIEVFMGRGEITGESRLSL